MGNTAQHNFRAVFRPDHCLTGVKLHRQVKFPGTQKSDLLETPMRKLSPRVLFTALSLFLCLLFATSAFAQAPDATPTPDPSASPTPPAGAATDDQSATPADPNAAPEPDRIDMDND